MIVLALGQKGAGKSRLLRSLAAKRLIKYPRSCVLVHDPLDQWQGGNSFASCDELRRVAEAGQMPRLARITADSANRVCALAWDLGELTVVIDELDTVCNSKAWSKDEPRMHGKGAAYCLAHYGRHRRVDLFGSFRFTRNLNEDLPSLADFVFLLRHSDAALYDLRSVSSRFGSHFGGTDAMIQTVTTIPDHECLVWSDRRG